MRVKMLKTGEARTVGDDYGLRLVSMGRAVVCTEPAPITEPHEPAIQPSVDDEPDAIPVPVDKSKRGRRKGEGAVTEDEPD